jgi:hypothetical protein
MFDFDHIEAWGPRLCRELSVAVPGDVSQAIASGKPKLIEDARDKLALARKPAALAIAATTQTQLPSSPRQPPTAARPTL